MSALLLAERYYHSRATHPVAVAMSYTVRRERSCAVRACVCAKWITLGEYGEQSTTPYAVTIATPADSPDCFTCHAGRQQDLKSRFVGPKDLERRPEDVLVPDSSNSPTAPCGCPRWRSLSHTRITGIFVTLSRLGFTKHRKADITIGSTIRRRCTTVQLRIGPID